jgi:hypothetical protein
MTPQIKNAYISKSTQKKRTWLDMKVDKEQEILNEIHENVKKIIEIRRFLLSMGKYELEEGEIL